MCLIVKYLSEYRSRPGIMAERNNMQISDYFVLIFTIAFVVCLSAIVIMYCYARNCGSKIMKEEVINLMKGVVVQLFVLLFVFCLGIWFFMERCPNCNTVVKGEPYCESCGERIEAISLCPSCHIKCDTPFCGNCGAEVK